MSQLCKDDFMKIKQKISHLFIPQDKDGELEKTQLS
jgi:hypothetical protein